jgi:hypothetical protein
MVASATAFIPSAIDPYQRQYRTIMRQQTLVTSTPCSSAQPAAVEEPQDHHHDEWEDNHHRQDLDHNHHHHHHHLPSNIPIDITRRNSLFISWTVLISTSWCVLTTPPLPAFAKKEKLPLTRENVRQRFDAVKFELLSGGIPFIKSRLGSGDYNGLLEYTKDYDLKLRKLLMGNAASLLTATMAKDKAQQLRNAVTFDLIGINQACRPASFTADQIQDRAVVAFKYYAELVDDVTAFLQLESIIDDFTPST